jgi:ERCC4-type nuclease
MLGRVKLRIYVDSREPKHYHEFLETTFPNHIFEIKALPEGDYETDKVVCERKTIADLYGSIVGSKDKKGRLPNQISRLSCHNDQVVVMLISGDIGTFMRDMKKIGINIKPEIIFGAIASMSCRENIRVLWLTTPQEALIAMVTFMNHVEEGKLNIPSRREPDVLLSRYFKVTPSQWKDIVKKFPSFFALSQASEKELMTIKGIGKTKAKAIKDMINNGW